MKSILLVLGTPAYREPLLDAVATIWAGQCMSLHIVCLSSSGTAAAGNVEDRPAWLREVPAASVKILPWSEPAAVVERARVLGVDLIALAPELPPESGPLWLDPNVVRVAAGAEQAVLVFRGSGTWPLRKVLLPLDGSTSATDALARVRESLEALFGAVERPADEFSPELHVLQAAPDMDKWYEMQCSLAAETERLPADQVHLQSCMRFGTAPERRILSWVAHEAPDLLVLERPPGGLHESHTAWLRVMCSTQCSVLLLPSPPDPPRERRGSFWHQLARPWSARSTGELLPSA